MTRPDITTVLGTLAGAASFALDHFRMEAESPNCKPHPVVLRERLQRLERALALYDAYCGLTPRTAAQRAVEARGEDLESALRASLKGPL